MKVYFVYFTKEKTRELLNIIFAHIIKNEQKHKYLDIAILFISHNNKNIFSGVTGNIKPNS